MTTFAAIEDMNWLGLNVIDWAVITVYFVVVVGIGVWSYRKVKDMSDYFMGGRRFGKIFMMFFAFGAGTSSDQAITVVAGTWRLGLAGIWWQFLWLWATPFYWIVAPVLRRMRALTTADYFEHRFNSATATLYSVYGIVISIVFIAAGLYGSGKMINALTGGELDKVAATAQIAVPDVKFQWDGGFEVGERRLQGYEFAILAMTVMFVIYGMAGGLGAAIITDFIQGILTIIFSFLLLPYVFYQIGGFGMLSSAENRETKDGMLDLVASPEVAASLGQEPITVFYIVMLSVTALCGIVVQPHIMGVCGAGKTEMEGRFGFTFGNFLKRFCTMAWTFTGLACIVWYLGSNSPLKTSADPADREMYEAINQRANFSEFKATVLAGELSADESASLERAKAELAETTPGERRKQMTAELARLQSQVANLPEKERVQVEEKLQQETERIEELDRKFADELFGRAAYDILPYGLIGLLLASLLAAVMSTSDAQMVVSSGLFTENVYKRFLVRNASQHHYLWVGRFTGLIIVAVALVLQASFTDVIDALKVVLKTPAAIGISLWFGIVWRRWTTAAVWASTLSSVAAWWFVSNEPGMLREWGVPESLFNVKGNLLDAWQMTAYLSVGVVVGIVVSLLTPQPSKERLDRFYDLLHTPIKPGEKPETPCSLPDDHLPRQKKLFESSETIELPRPTWVGIVGFLAAWACVAFIVWLTRVLAGWW